MPEFDEHLSASIASAKAKLAEREDAKRAAEAVKQQQAKALADKFAEVKSRAMRFKNNHLEPLFRKAQQEVNQAGFHFVGNFINDEGQLRGRVGSTLESGESCFIMAAIDYTLERSTARVEAQTASGSCYSQSLSRKNLTKIHLLLGFRLAWLRPLASYLKVVKFRPPTWWSDTTAESFESPL